MSTQRIKTRSGYRYRYVKMVRRKLLWSLAIYLTKRDAERAESGAIEEFLKTGKIPSELKPISESVKNLIIRRLQWLRDNRGEKHTHDTESTLKRAAIYAVGWADLPADGITPEMVSELKKRWGDDLRSRGKTMTDCNRGLSYLQTVWGGPWDSKRGKREYPDNPFAYIERFSYSKKAKTYPTDQQINAVLKGVDGEKRLYLYVLVGTGARPGEALKLKVEDLFLDQEPYSLILWTQKKKGGNRSPRRINITTALAKSLRDQKESSPEAVYLFQQKGKPEPRVDRWVANLQRAACKAAEVPYFSPHGYRHWYASRQVRAGKNLLEIQNLLGHENAKTTTIYLHELMGV